METASWSVENSGSLSPAIWAQWALIVVDFHGEFAVEEDQEPHNDIARHCAHKAPDVVAISIKKYAAQPLGDNSLFILPRFVQRAWSECVREA